MDLRVVSYRVVVLYSIPLTLQNRFGTAMNYLDKKLYMYFSITHVGYVTRLPYKFTNFA